MTNGSTFKTADHSSKDDPRESQPRGSESFSSQFHTLRKDLGAYIEKRIELVLLTLTEPLSKAIAGVLQQSLAVLFFSFGLLFVGIALALLIAEQIGSYVAGFLIVSLPLLLLGFLFYRRTIGGLQRSVQAGMMESLLELLPQTDAGRTKEEGRASAGRNAQHAQGSTRPPSPASGEREAGDAEANGRRS